MTEPVDPRWACHRKRAFPTERDAARAMARMRDAGRDDERLLNTYRCVWCACWHVGHASRHP